MNCEKGAEFFIIAGEASGDLHGAQLVQALRTYDHAIQFFGVPGPHMRLAGVASVLSMERFQVMGFSDVFSALPRLWRQGKVLLQAIQDRNPAAVIFIDYPGLNLRLAHRLRLQGYKGKLIHYICPAVWAWRRQRIAQMAKSLNLLLVHLPFEVSLFHQTPLPVKYVGQPLLDIVNKYSYCTLWREKVGIAESAQLISLFPGSREGEVQRNLPVQLEAAQKFMHMHPSCIFVVSVANEQLKPIIENILQRYPTAQKAIAFVPAQYTYECMKESVLAVAKSGTVTLELALHSIPTIVGYSLSYVNYFIAKYLFNIRLPYYSLANVAAQKAIFPELIATYIDPEKLCALMHTWYSDIALRKQCVEECLNLKGNLMQPQEASYCAAKYIIECLH